MSHPIHKHMSGQSYDAKKAYDKDLTASARLHYLENSEHDKGVSRRSAAKEVAYNEDHVPQREEAAGTKKEGISRRSAVDPAEAVMEGKPDTREGATKPPTKPKKG